MRASTARAGRLRNLVTLLALAALLAACGQNMSDQPRTEAYQSSPFFEGGAAMQALPDGVVSRSEGDLDPAYLTGQGPDGQVTDLPIDLSVDLLLRGQERYGIYCAVCHGYDGRGDGVAVQRGFPRPTSFHEPRLLDASVGYVFGAATNGFGRMYGYASRIPTEDRWAIAAYVKALQLSQNAERTDLPADVLDTLETSEGSVR
ncbi:MAG: cytochrome c [Trueperaceae bacterium]